jgi:type IV secretory pathway protease TraF
MMTNVKKNSPAWKLPVREQFRLTIRYGVPVTLLFALFFYVLSLNITFGINRTGSIPISEAPFLYAVRDGKIPKRGEFIAFKPAHTLRYYQGYDTWVKTLYGLPGDEVTYVGNTFYINGKPVVRTKEKAKDGQVLTPGPTGVLPDCMFFVATEHPDGYDSRYDDIGWITCKQIIGRAYAFP